MLFAVLCRFPFLSQASLHEGWDVAISFRLSRPDSTLHLEAEGSGVVHSIVYGIGSRV